MKFSPLIFLFPIVPCALSPVTRVSGSPLCEKRSTWGGGRLWNDTHSGMKVIPVSYKQPLRESTKRSKEGMQSWLSIKDVFSFSPHSAFDLWYIYIKYEESRGKKPKRLLYGWKYFISVLSKAKICNLHPYIKGRRRAFTSLACVSGAKWERGGREKGRDCPLLSLPNPLPFSVSPNRLPLSTPAALSIKLVIVVTKSAPDLLKIELLKSKTPCGCPCICHEPLKCSFRVRVSEYNSFVFFCVFSIITLCFLG